MGTETTAGLRQETPAVNNDSQSFIGSQFTRDRIGPISLANEITHYTVKTIYKLIHQKKIPNYKRGRRVYFKESELIAWMTENRRATIDEIEAAAIAGVKKPGNKRG